MRMLPQNAIFEIVSRMEGRIGLYIEVLDTGERLEINANHIFPSASIIKLPILALLLKDASEGRVDLSAAHPVAEQNRVGGTGILRELDAGYEPSLGVLAKLMIVLSDNSATNEIIDVVGVERVNEFCQSLGLVNTKLMRKMMDTDAIRQGRNNYMSAEDAGKLLSAIAGRTLISPEISEMAENILMGQQCRNKLPSLLPAVPCYAPLEEHLNLKHGTVLVGNKTGDLSGIQHDAGIFVLPDGKRYVISAFTGDLSWDRQGIDTIAGISAAVYEALRERALTS